MSTLTIELSDELAARLEAVSAAEKVGAAKWATDAVAKALTPAESSFQEVNGWPPGYFQKYAGCLADDDWQPPADPPPERIPE